MTKLWTSPKYVSFNKNLVLGLKVRVAFCGVVDRVCSSRAAVSDCPSQPLTTWKLRALFAQHYHCFSSYEKHNFDVTAMFFGTSVRSNIWVDGKNLDFYVLFTFMANFSREFFSCWNLKTRHEFLYKLSLFQYFIFRKNYLLFLILL